MSELPLLVSFPDERASIDMLAEQFSWDREAVRRAPALFRRRLPPLVDTRCLSYLFGVSPRLISAMPKFANRHYRFFEIPKRSGATRHIEAPRRFLKLLQRWVYDHVLASAETSSFATGFVRGKSIFDNAQPHSSGQNLMVIDIKDFFPSVKRDSVIQVFLDRGYSREVAYQLASLCLLEGRLPQGAPTSPSLANLVMLPVDEELASLATNWECKYTRYADDLAFSGSRRFRKQDIRRVQSTLRRHGFAVNQEKSRIIGSGGRQVVTGLVVNSVPKPPRWKRRLWRAMFNRASKHPREYSDRSLHLRGISAFVNQYDSGLASTYRSIADRVGETKGTSPG